MNRPPVEQRPSDTHDTAFRFPGKRLLPEPVAINEMCTVPQVPFVDVTVNDSFIAALLAK